MDARLARSLAPLSYPAYRLQFAAQATSVLGDNIAPIAIAFAVLRLTGSAVDLGLVLAAQSVPMIAFLLLGGVWADRLPRRRLMIGADLVRVASQGASAAVVLAGGGIVWLAVLQAVYGIATAFFRPAVIGLTPRTVPPEHLQQANALLSLSISLTAVVGPAIAGVVVAASNAGWGLAIDALTFLGSAYFLGRLRVVEDERLESHNWLSDLRNGWYEVVSRTWVWASILNFMLFQLLILSTFQVLGPLVARQHLHGASSWAIIVGAAGVGSIVGDVLALRIEPQRPLRAAFLTGLLFPPVLVLLALHLPTLVIAPAAVVYGIAWTFPNTLWFTTLQEHIPPEAISRVSSYDWMGSSILRPLGYAFAGVVAGAAGTAATLIGAAALFTLAQLLALTVPAIVTLERRSRPAAAAGPAS